MAEKSDDLVIGVSTDMTAVQRALRKLGADIGASASQIERQFAKAGQGMDKSLTTAMQTRINAMVGVGAKASKEWTGALAEQGAELDRLRGKFSPVFSTITRYKATVGEIRQAHRLGAISADEMTSAINRERTAALASIEAIKGRNTALASASRGPGGGFNTANIAAQFQDIGVTAAMGMSPLQIALQQGTQLSSVFEQMKANGQSVGSGLAAAFTSIISPMSLVTIGLIAGGAAAAQYFFSATKGAESLDDILSRHEKNIERLGPAYDAVRKKANEYATDPTVVNALLGDDMKKAGAKLKEEIANTLSAIQSELLQFAAKNNGSLLGNRLAGADELIASLREGKIEIGDFLKEATALEAAGKISPEAASALRGYAQAADDVARAIAGMTPNVTIAEAAFGNLSAAIENITTDYARKELEELMRRAQEGSVSVEGVEYALHNLSGTSPDLSAAAGSILDLFAKAVSAKAAIDALAGPIGGETVAGGKTSRPGAMDRLQEEYNQALAMSKRFGDIGEVDLTPKKEKGAKAPKKTADDRFFEDIEAIRQRTIALAAETAMVGASFEAQTKRRAAFDLEQKALKDVREAARQKGDQDWQNAQLSSEQIAKIDEVSDAYSKQAETLRKTQEAQADLEDWMNVGRSATRGFIDDMIAGKSAGEQFAGVLGKIGDQLLDLAMNDMFGKGGGGGLGLLGSLFGLGGGGGKSDPWGGMRENGGSVQAGKAYVVGEKRAELFVPGRSGTIIPQVPQMPRVQAPANQNSGPAITYAPTNHFQGTSEELAAFRQEAARDRAQFSARVVATVRKAQSTRQI